MRMHYLLNQGAAPESKLADVEIHFEEGILSGLKLVGCSVWRSKKGEGPTVLIPSRSYATATGVRYYELLRPSEEGTAEGKTVLREGIKQERDAGRGPDRRGTFQSPGSRPKSATYGKPILANGYLNLTGRTAEQSAVSGSPGARRVDGDMKRRFRGAGKRFSRQPQEPDDIVASFFHATFHHQTNGDFHLPDVIDTVHGDVSHWRPPPFRQELPLI
jgi:hypothetical protein